MRNLTHNNLNQRTFFPKSGHFFQFPKNVRKNFFPFAPSVLLISETQCILFGTLGNNWSYNQVFKCYVRYNFDLSFNSNREHFWNSEKYNYFTLKSPFILEILKFQIFRISDFMMSSNAFHETRKTFLEYLESKHSPIMNLGQLM